MFFDILSEFGAAILGLVEWFSGWRPNPAQKDRLQYVVALLGIGTGALAAWRAGRTLLRMTGGGKTLTSDEQVIVDAVATKVRDAVSAETATQIAALKDQLTRIEASGGGKTSGAAAASGGIPPPAAAGAGLAGDLDAGIETLLAAGKSAALADKSGVDARAALDVLIKEHERARERIARDEAVLHCQKGAFAFLHDTAGALAAYRRATELDPGDANGWNQLGHLLMRVGDLDGALLAYERVPALGNRATDRAAVAIATGNVGLVYLTRGDLDQAEAMFLDALALDEALDRTEGMANHTGNLGVVYLIRGDLDRAKMTFEKALALEETLDRKEGMAAATGNLGGVSWRRGDLDQAEEMFLKSLALSEALDRTEDMANATGALGVVYLKRDDLDQAEAMFIKSLVLDEALDRKKGIAVATGNLGLVYERRGDLATACAYWMKALRLFKAIGMTPQVAQTEGWIRDGRCGEA